MQRRFSVLIIATVASNLWFATAVQSQAERRKPQTSTATQQRTLSPREIASKVSHSLVLIVTQDKEGQPISSGSGFFYKVKHEARLPAGVHWSYSEIATSLHVFKRASQGYIKMLGDGATYKITKIIGIDMQHDLCVFRASDAMGLPLTLATGTNRAVGDDVYVAGNPRGLEATISKGIVSAFRSDNGLIQIDAAISPGSSGGPVVNTRAEVVGIAASSRSDGQNLNFAIDASYLGALPLDWNAPVTVAGALSLKDREKEELRGPVGSVTTMTVPYDYDRVSDTYLEGRPAALRTTLAFDNDGNLVERVVYADGELSLKIRYEYNERGFMIRKSISGRLVAGEKTVAVSEDEFVNDKINDSRHSSVSESDAIASDGSKSVMKTVRTFDSRGWMAEENVYFDGKLGYSYRYRYEVDTLGNWIKRYSTMYLQKYPELGFTSFQLLYRDVKYYDGR